MHLKVGQTLKSMVDTTTLIVMRTAPEDVDVLCGGEPMGGSASANSANVAAPDSRRDAGCRLGKRYIHHRSGLELLCVKAGQSLVTVDGEHLQMLESKQLPSSD
jgi:hypothetical protein